MLHVEIDMERGIAHVRPEGKLQHEDFIEAGTLIDPYIEHHGDLRGIVVSARYFPGWLTFGDLVHHFRFVRDHQHHVRRVALVTDAPLGAIAELVARHFGDAEVRHFPYGDHQAAEHWVDDAPPQGA